MNDQERYLFDLQGFLEVPDALSAEQLTELNRMMDEKIEGEMAWWLRPAGLWGI